MSSKRAETVESPRAALVSSLDEGRTGCFSADGPTNPRVYVMLGEVLAAHGTEDDEALFRRLKQGHLLDDAGLAGLAGRDPADGPLAEALFDLVPDDTLQKLLHDRFRENLFRFLLAPSLLGFEPLEVVFAENIQVGHDSRALVEELLALQARVASLLQNPDMVLAAGAAPARSPEQEALLKVVDSRMRLSELLLLSPYETSRTLGFVQDMLDEGMLVGVVPQRTGRTLPPGGPVAASPAPVVPPPPLAPDPTQVETAPPEPPAPALTDEPDADEDTVETPITPVRRPAAPSYAEEDTGEDLAAFQDYDTSREGGSFSTERDLLDRVDLDGAPASPSLAPSTETLIEMEDAEHAGKDALKSAVSLNFSGPKLSEDEVQRKLGVTNDVLATIAAAIDHAEGRGAGHARLQLLVEGTAVSLAPLFTSVELTKDGRLPVGPVVKNLKRRPVGEHRRLLNRGLSDLIERALSAADEVLDEEGLESMLEQIAGYQQRLGV